MWRGYNCNQGEARVLFITTMSCKHIVPGWISLLIQIIIYLQQKNLHQTVLVLVWKFIWTRGFLQDTSSKPYCDIDSPGAHQLGTTCLDHKHIVPVTMSSVIKVVQSNLIINMLCAFVSLIFNYLPFFTFSLEEVGLLYFLQKQLVIRS